MQEVSQRLACDNSLAQWHTSSLLTHAAAAMLLYILKRITRMHRRQTDGHAPLRCNMHALPGYFRAGPARARPASPCCAVPHVFSVCRPGPICRARPAWPILLSAMPCTCFVKPYTRLQFDHDADSYEEKRTKIVSINNCKLFFSLKNTANCFDGHGLSP